METVEKADFVEFLNDDSSTLAGFEEEISTWVIFILPQKFTFGENKQVGPVKSTIFSMVKKPKFLSAVSGQILNTDVVWS